MNQIFGFQILSGDNPTNKFIIDGTYSAVPNTDVNAISPQINILSGPNASIWSCYSVKYKAYCYVWGIPVHPEISASDIPEWCTQIVTNKHYDRFKELIGSFVIIVDIPEKNRIIFVTDILGIRPMFWGSSNGRVVFGSQVWPLLKAGLSKGVINYDAVSAWIAYGYNCTDGSLFSDLHRLPPGSAILFQDNQCSEISYVEYNADIRASTTRDIVKDLHDIVSSTVKTLLKDHNRVSLSLSGGFDSRYLLALINSKGKTSIDCATVGSPEEESLVASRVAQTLGVHLETYPVDSSIWDLFDEVYHLTPDGFPILKNLNYIIADHYSGVPMVNGFMGDPLMRGSRDSINGKYEDEWDEDLADVMQHKHLLFYNLNLIQKDRADKILMRSRVPLEKAVQEALTTGKIFAWTDFHYRQRLYISNNFIEHFDICEALLPFYSWELLSYKMSHKDRAINTDVYKMIFQNYFPELSMIPHSSELKITRKKIRKISKCSQKWAGEILPLLFDKNWLSLLKKREPMLRSIAGIIGMPQGENSVIRIKGLYLLERIVRDADLDFTWDSI